MSHDSRPSSATLPVASPEASLLRDAVERHRAVLAERLATGEDGLALGRANARFLKACFDSRFREATRLAGPSTVERGGLALAAVGSLGRGAVALRSDADVVLIVDATKVDARDAAAFAEALLYPLWDATLAVGHQVLSVADAIPLAQADLATATALLDLRMLAGDEAPLRDLTTRANEGLFGEQELG